MDRKQCNENRCVNILYVGDEVLGKRFRTEARQDCLQVTVLTGTGWEDPCAGRPDVVILEDFPESGPAREAFYHFRPDKGIRFVALNDNPNDLRFIHLDSLSFLKMLPTDTAPRKILNETVRMLSTGNRRTLTAREVCCPGGKSAGTGHGIPYRVSNRACC